LACSIAEQKALRSLPASFVPTPSRVRMALEAMPEVVQTVVQRLALRTACCRTPSRACPAFGSTGRHPMPRPSSPSSFEHAHSAAHAVLALMGYPCEVRSYALHRPGLSVRGDPMQVDDATNRGLIPYRRKARPSRRCCPCPLRPGFIPITAERRNAMAGRITVSFLRLTEPTDAHSMRHRQTLGKQTRRGRASCRKQSTTPLTRYGIQA